MVGDSNTALPLLLHWLVCVLRRFLEGGVVVVRMLVLGEEREVAILRTSAARRLRRTWGVGDGLDPPLALRPLPVRTPTRCQHTLDTR